MTRETIETMTGQAANLRFGNCVEAQCEDGFYRITGGSARKSLRAAISPWSLDDVRVTVLADGLRGWADYTHFVRVTSTDGELIFCLMCQSTATGGMIPGDAPRVKTLSRA